MLDPVWSQELRLRAMGTFLYWQIGVFKGNEFLAVVLLEEKPQILVLISPGDMECRTKIMDTEE